MKSIKRIKEKVIILGIGVGLFFVAQLVFMPGCWADIYNIYNDAGIPHESQLWTWFGSGGSVETISDPQAPERVAYSKTISQSWAGWGIFFDAPSGGSPWTLDFSNYSQGSLKFFVKTPVNLKVEIQKVDSSGTKYTKYIANYGWNGQNEWQEISIPISDFTTSANLSQIYSPFMITAETQATFYVDYVRWVMPISGYTPIQVQVNGYQLLVNNNVFTVKGVSAEFTPVGEYGPGYDWSLFPDNYTIDIPLIAAIGANVIRTYDQRPTQRAMLDDLYQHHIYVIMGFPVDALYGSSGEVVDFGDSVVRDNIKDRFLDMVGHWKSHPAILMWCIGNEVNKALEDNGVSPSDWYSLVEECALAAHQLEGANYHPVTTANADQVVWDIGDSTINADDASLPNLDVWSVQLYRGASFGQAFNDYEASSNKPLLITEFGCDAYDGGTHQEDQATQESYLVSQWTEIKQNLSSLNANNVCAGGVIFSWRDGWYKSNSGSYSMHDTQADWQNSAYDDPNMNEEWWGLVGISSTNPQQRILRQAYSHIYVIWNNIHITPPKYPSAPHALEPDTSSQGQISKTTAASKR